MKAVSLAKTPEDETENLLWAYLNMFDVYFNHWKFYSADICSIIGSD
jgi:hypothetical protein